MGVAENVKKWKEMVSKKEELLVKSRNRVAFAWTLVALCYGNAENEQGFFERLRLFSRFRRAIPVSVKIFQHKRTSTVSIEQKKKFQREVLLLSKIKHENIVQFIGACIEPTLMIITELMEGNTLQKFMLSTRPKPLDLKLSISFALDIARGMEFMFQVSYQYLCCLCCQQKPKTKCGESSRRSCFDPAIMLGRGS